jgi:O-antigen chain-terminating methyltransferase
MEQDAEKITELRSIVEGIRDRVRAEYPETAARVEGSGISVPLADLMPVVHARDAAQGKMAAIGTVNPRAGGLANNVIQSVKRTIARGLYWFVRDQVVFNRGALACVEALVESVNEVNRAMVSLSGQIGRELARSRKETAESFKALEPRFAHAETRAERLVVEARNLAGLAAQWPEVQRHAEQMDRKLAEHRAEALRLSIAFEERARAMETSLREFVEAQHGDFSAALARGLNDIQTRLWDDMQRVRLEFERTIHAELRLVRQRGAAAGAPAPAQETTAPAMAFDYQAFSNRFRGTEDYIKAGQRFYVPYFQGAREVLDIGCGRGEFLEVMREAAIPARGIDLSDESVAECRRKGLAADAGDLFTYLDGLPDHSLAGIFSAQVVEHITPERLPEMIRLCAAKLERGALLAIETPNPECLAIFATHFYLDPTHTRPVPHPLLAFYMEEFGLGGIETHPRFPAPESWPELNELPEGVRNRFFGGLDYAIFGRKL